MNLGIDLRQVRLEVEKALRSGLAVVTTSTLPRTPRAKKVVEQAIEEARTLDHDYVGTEHLLLGLLREQEGVAAPFLRNRGLTLEGVRQEALDVLGPFLEGGTPGLGGGGRRYRGLRLQGLPAAELPAEVGRALAPLDARIGRLNAAKEAAAAGHDFHEAARLRRRGADLGRRRRRILRAWRAGHLPDPTWLTWRGGTVAALARAIEASRRWRDLPVLADALEEAGCADPEILGHCRRPGEHGRGCWVVALLLGRCEANRSPEVQAGKDTPKRSFPTEVRRH
jgi:hypothetical protein